MAETKRFGINGKISSDTQEEKMNKIYNKLVYTRGSRKGDGAYITSKVSYIEPHKSFVAAVCNYEGYKIVIPENEFMDFPPYDPINHPYESEQKMHEVLMRQCINSEIEFCLMPKKKVNGKVMDTISKEDRFAFASRKHAMRKLYDEFWAKDKHGNAQITEGTELECRVVRVSNTTAWFESCGLEFKISHKELSWGRLGNVRSKLKTGERAWVLIEKIEYPEDPTKGRAKVTASMKKLEENPRERICQKMKIGTICSGQITVPYKGSFFVKTDGEGAEVLCGMTTALSRFPNRDDHVTIKVTAVNLEKLEITGQIIAINEPDDMHSEW